MTHHREAGRLGGLRSAENGANQRRFLEYFAAEALRLGATPEEAPRFAVLLRQKHLIEAGRLGGLRKEANRQARARATNEQRRIS